jgi:hypothetical protein
MKYGLVFLLVSFSCLAQTLKPVTVIKQRTYYLNGGVRTTVVDGKSRELIKIDLPKNTKGCYYSFTTAPGEDGTKLLDLGLQLTAAIYGGTPGMAIASKIKVPAGADAVDVYVLSPGSVKAFMAKEDKKWKSHRDISVHNAKDAVQYIDNTRYGNSFYIGLRNPSALSGIGIAIEVVAMVEEPVVDTPKAELYGDLGWKSYEKKDYKKALTYYEKALAYDPNLAYVHFNRGLVYLLQGKANVVDRYVEAIALAEKDADSQKIFQNALVDLKALQASAPTLKNIDTIVELVSNEIKTP